MNHMMKTGAALVAILALAGCQQSVPSFGGGGVGAGRDVGAGRGVAAGRGMRVLQAGGLRFPLPKVGHSEHFRDRRFGLRARFPARRSGR